MLLCGLKPSGAADCSPDMLIVGKGESQQWHLCLSCIGGLKPGEPQEANVTPISKDFEEYWVLRKWNHWIKNRFAFFPHKVFRVHVHVPQTQCCHIPLVSLQSMFWSLCWDAIDCSLC